MIDEIQNDETIKMTNSNSYKQFIKSKIRMRALKYLKSFQQTHSKVKEIVYEKLEVQPYLTSPLFSNDEVNLLHRLRSRMTECKANFKQKYVHNLKCRLCNLEVEDQQHLLHCVELSKLFQTQSVTKGKVKYEDIFSPNIEQQKVATAESGYNRKWAHQLGTNGDNTHISLSPLPFIPGYYSTAQGKRTQCI